MELLYRPAVDCNWAYQVLESLKAKYPGYQFDTGKSTFSYLNEMGSVAGQHLILCPENLSISFTESNLNCPVSLKTIPVYNSNIYIIQFNLSQHTNYFQTPDAAKPVICKNGINSCLFSSAAHEVTFRQEPNHTFRHLQIIVSKAYLSDLFKVLAIDFPSQEQLFLLDGDLTQLYDLFVDDMRVLDDMVRIFKNPHSSPEVDALLLTYNIQRLVSTLFQNMKGLGYQKRVGLKQMELKNIEEMKELIEKQPNQRYSLGEAANLNNMSISKFKKAFKKSTGQTFTKYYHGVRMEAYMQKISGNLKNSITDIAHEAGYTSLSQFTKIFRSHYGKAPSLFQHDGRNKLS